MKIFVTGAGGFIGRSVTALARSRGHDVVELVRGGGSGGAGVAVRRSVIMGDLRESSAPWTEALEHCDVVIHLAGSIMPSGDASESMVTGTRQLLGAMTAREVDRLVLVSSISVYDYRAIRPGDVVDEHSPLQLRPRDRDAYVCAKLAQEQLAADWTGLQTTVLRPGAVYGVGRLWNAGRAFEIGKQVGVAIGPHARMKVTFVENCSEAILLAAERDDSAGAVANVVDDLLPTQREFAAALARHRLDVSHTVPIPYRVASMAARLTWGVSQRWLRGRPSLPGLLVPGRLDARYKPLEYSNAEAKRVLGWKPRVSLDEALARVAAQTTVAPLEP